MTCCIRILRSTIPTSLGLRRFRFMTWLRIFLVVSIVDWLSQFINTRCVGSLLIIPTFRYAEKKFRRDGITIMTSHHVERVESVSVIEAPRLWFHGLTQLMVVVGKDVRQGEGRRYACHIRSIFTCMLTTSCPVPFGLLVWSTGLAPNPLIETISPDEVKKHPKTGRSARPSLEAYISRPDTTWSSSACSLMTT